MTLNERRNVANKSRQVRDFPVTFATGKLRGNWSRICLEFASNPLALWVSHVKLLYQTVVCSANRSMFDQCVVNTAGKPSQHSSSCLTSPADEVSGLQYVGLLLSIRIPPAARNKIRKIEIGLRTKFL